MAVMVVSWCKTSWDFGLGEKKGGFWYKNPIKWLILTYIRASADAIWKDYIDIFHFDLNHQQWDLKNFQSLSEQQAVYQEPPHGQVCFSCDILKVCIQGQH